MYGVDRSGHGTHSSPIGLGFETQERVVGRNTYVLTEGQMFITEAFSAKITRLYAM